MQREEGNAMTVEHILKDKHSSVITVLPTCTIAEAAQLLADRRIGAVVVTDEHGGLAGILSERDIVSALAANGAAVLVHPVSRHMTQKVETAKRGDAIIEIMERMTNGRFRHLPVLEEGQLCGIVSIGDVVKHRVAEMEAETQAMRNYITA